MAKSFVSKRSPAGISVMTDAISGIYQDLRQAEKQYGRASLEAAEPLLILGAAHYIVEDYGKAEGMFIRYIEIVKTKLGPNTSEAFHGLGTLAEITGTSRIPRREDLCVALIAVDFNAVTTNRDRQVPIEFSGLLEEKRNVAADK